MEIFVAIGEWLALLFMGVMIFAGVLHIRRAVSNGERVSIAVLASNAGYLLSLLGVLYLGVSPLHLFWLYVASFALGFFVLLPVVNLFLAPVARAYGWLCTFGVDPPSSGADGRKLSS